MAEPLPPDDGKRWGFMETQRDGTIKFVAVPKIPLILAGVEPPVTVQLFHGPRDIIKEPDDDKPEP